MGADSAERYWRPFGSALGVTKFIFLLLLAFHIQHASAGDQFNESERLQLVEMREGMRRSCEERRISLLAKKNYRNNTAYLKWARGAYMSTDFCACPADAYIRSLTPATLHAMSDVDDDRLVRRVTYECMLAKYKDTFPEYCEGMSNEFGLTIPNSSNICTCTSEVLDSLPTEAFEPFLRASGSDYVRYLHDGVLPAPSNKSLLAIMNRCSRIKK